MKIKQFSFLVFLSIILLLVIGCNENNDLNHENNSINSNIQDPEVQEEVTLTVGASRFYDEELFDALFQKPVHDKHPHITLERVDNPWDIVAIEEQIVAEELPDLIVQPDIDLPIAAETGIFMDLEPYIEKHGFDLSIFKPEMVDLMMDLGEVIDDVKIPAFPINMDNSAMIYNKEIFDVLGLDYPEDGMTWDEVIELAKMATQEKDGVQYKGLVTMPPTNFGSQLSLYYVDPETEGPAVNTPEWRKALETLMEIHTITGNEDSLELGYNWVNLFGEQDIAMYPRVNVYEQTLSLTEEDINFDWDIVQYPSFPESPNVGYGAISHTVLVTSTTEYPDEAFHALTALVSSEAQQKLTEYMMTPTVDIDINEDDFGKNYPLFEGKNLNAILKSDPAPVPIDKSTIYDQPVLHRINELYRDKIIEENFDINTSIRVLEEEIEQIIHNVKSED